MTHPDPGSDNAALESLEFDEPSAREAREATERRMQGGEVEIITSPRDDIPLPAQVWPVPPPGARMPGPRMTRGARR